MKLRLVRDLSCVIAAGVGSGELRIFAPEFAQTSVGRSEGTRDTGRDLRFGDSIHCAGGVRSCAKSRRTSVNRLTATT